MIDTGTLTRAISHSCIQHDDINSIFNKIINSINRIDDENGTVINMDIDITKL